MDHILTWRMPQFNEYLNETVTFKIRVLFLPSTLIIVVSCRHKAAGNGSQASHIARFTTHYFPESLIKAVHLTTYEAVVPFSPTSVRARV